MGQTKTVPELMHDALEYYKQGREWAKVARERPDIAHAFLLGVRDQLEELGMPITMGDTLFGLEHRGRYVVPEKACLPFLSLKRAPSGYGKLVLEPAVSG